MKPPQPMAQITQRGPWGMCELHRTTRGTSNKPTTLLSYCGRANHPGAPRIYGTWTPQVRTAKFEPLWIDKQDRITTKAHGGSQWSPWTQRILTYTLPQLVLARYLKLKKDGKLTAESVRFMMALPGVDCHVALSNKQAVIDALVWL